MSAKPYTEDHLVEQPAIALFAQRLMGVVEPKFNRQLYDGRLEGYGMVLFPKGPQ